MAITLERAYKPVRRLLPPGNRKELEIFDETADPLIDSTPEDEVVDVQVILDNLEDAGLGVTKEWLRDRYCKDFDYVRCLRTFISLDEIRRIAEDVANRIQSGETDITFEKYRNLYSEQEGKKYFDACIDGLFEELIHQIAEVTAGRKWKVISRSAPKPTVKKSTGKSVTKSTVKKLAGKKVTKSTVKKSTGKKVTKSTVKKSTGKR